MSLTKPVSDRTTPAGRLSARGAAAALSLCLAILVLTATGCEPEFEGTDKIDYLRSKYTVELTAFTLRDFVEPAAQMDEDEMGEDESGEDDGAVESEGGVGTDVEADAEAGEMTQPTVRQDGYLDLLVSTTAKEPLPGITVDFYLQGPDGAEKATHRAYIDTEGVTYGNAAQIGVVWEGVPYEEGDALAAQVREPVPESERPAYREYDGL